MVNVTVTDCYCNVLVSLPPFFFVLKSEDQAVLDAETEHHRLTEASGGARLGLLSQVSRPDTSTLGAATGEEATVPVVGGKN